MPESTTYLDVAIELPAAENGYRFRVQETAADDVRTRDYASLDEAKKAIEASARAHAKLSLSVLTFQGDQATVTGISMRDSTFNGLPPGAQHNGVYVDLPGVADKLRRIEELKTEAAHLQSEIDTFRIYSRSGYGGRMAPAQHLAAVERLQREYQDIVTRHEATAAVNAAAYTGRGSLT
jgi:hypothetical protein